ncbi:MAG: hypothetical protein J2P21_30580 [Chloracidobacterium sp.]|nr:hypothetical protein [Chloracidobacterium sp.]
MSTSTARSLQWRAKPEPRQDRDCEASPSDMRIKVPYRYPDVSAVCGDCRGSYDLVEKFTAYQFHGMEYLLISHIIRYDRQPESKWLRTGV